MIFDCVRLAFLTLVAADLSADLSSFTVTAGSFRAALHDFYVLSGRSDIAKTTTWVSVNTLASVPRVYVSVPTTLTSVPTTLTSDYESFSLALSSFNEALEGVGVNDLTSGSTALYSKVAGAFQYLQFVSMYLGLLGLAYVNHPGTIFSFVQDVIEDMNEPSIELVEKANFIMAENCSLAINGYGSRDLHTLLKVVSWFSQGYSGFVGELPVSVSALPTLSCLGGVTHFSLLFNSSFEPSGNGSATPAGSAISTGAPQSSVLEDSTSTIDPSTPTESLEERNTHGESTFTSASRGEAGSSSTGATSVSSDGAPILAINAGILVLIFSMLL